MKRQRVVLVVGLALGLGALTAMAGTGAQSERKATYASPQAVYAGVKAAMAKEDWKTVCGCLTPDSRDEAVGGLAFMPHLFKALAEGFTPDKAKGGQKTEKMLEPLFAVLKKHGFTPGNLDKVNFQTASKEEARKAMISLAASIKDRCGFIGDMLTALKSVSKGAPQTVTLGELRDVKITGDTATGVAVVTRAGKGTPTPLTFSRIDGSWRVDLPLQLGQPPVGPAKQ
jgi:hypothetical protein